MEDMIKGTHRSDLENETSTRITRPGEHLDVFRRLPHPVVNHIQQLLDFRGDSSQANDKPSSSCLLKGGKHDAQQGALAKIQLPPNTWGRGEEWMHTDREALAPEHLEL